MDDHRFDTLVELCVGSAALSLSLSGQKPPVAYAGSKAGYASEILGLLVGSKEKQASVTKFVWNDLGPWAKTWQCLVRNKARVEKEIRRRSARDSRETWKWAKSLVYSPPIKDVSPEVQSAAYLMLVASTYGGFDKGGFKGTHKHRPNVDGFIPSRVNLARRIQNLRPPDDCVVTCLDARDIEPFPAYCYIDPPYRGTTGYLCELKREDTISIAKRWKDAGAFVAISENEPISCLAEEGWSCAEISHSRTGQSRKNTKTKSEWLTFWNHS